MVVEPILLLFILLGGGSSEASSSSSAQQPGKAFKTYGFLRHSTSCLAASDGGHCRTKRSNLHPKLRDAHLDMELMTEHPLDGAGGIGAEPAKLRLRLKRSPQLLAPNFKFIVNDGVSGKSHTHVNETIAYPKCLYTGDVSEEGGAVGTVALSNCMNKRMKGLIQSSATNRPLVLEELDPSEHPEHLQRVKRSITSTSDEDDDNEPKLIMVYENPATGGDCGINKWNKEKMRAPTKTAVLLSDIEKAAADKFAAEQENNGVMEMEKAVGGADEDAVVFQNENYNGFDETNKRRKNGFDERNQRERKNGFDESEKKDPDDDIVIFDPEDIKPTWEEFPDAKSNEEFESSNGLSKRRRKRATEESTDKAIEIAVFVDDEIYQTEKEWAYGDEDKTLENIRAIVFTYLNSVQLLYNSAKLSTQFRLILVRLEVFRDEVKNLDKTRNIDEYLDSFCAWQKANNSGNFLDDPRIDTEDPDHWDHALILTGLNLYDRSEEYDDVIGLAWVSGMCYPDYSCSINEGSNFESVFVIAHELGHNLGMNHDGDTQDGNHCDENRFLMSPMLGPGKIHWSSCSNQEIQDFLGGSRTSAQSKCVDDLPPIMAHYDYIRDKAAPGSRYEVVVQCQRAFGDDFNPHRTDVTPYDDLCREIWCANKTHALRAHPALEGTGCKSTPYPYGSICISGECVPFDPDEPIQIYYGTLNKDTVVKPTDPDTGGDDNTVEENNPPSENEDPVVAVTNTGDNQGGTTNDDTGGGQASNVNDEQFMFVKNRPSWYDPIYTKIFDQLRKKISGKYPSANGQTRVLPASNSADEKSQSLQMAPDDEAMEEEEDFKVTAKLKKGKWRSPKWVMVDGTCSRECGAGWADVTYACSKAGSMVENEQCDGLEVPTQSKRPCNLDPCTASIEL